MNSLYADAVLPHRVSPFGYLRIEAYLQLPEAFRSLSRPSSAPDAKAFPLRSFMLDLSGTVSRVVSVQTSEIGPISWFSFDSNYADSFVLPTKL